MTPEAERFNGWAAMLGFVAAVGAYVTTGQIIQVGSKTDKINSFRSKTFKIIFNFAKYFLKSINLKCYEII